MSVKETVLVFDAEADGLVGQAKRAWCIGVRDYYDDNARLSSVDVYGPRSIEAGLQRLWDADVLIGHNIIGYDFELFYDLYDWKPNPKTIIIDTLVFSRALNPKRYSPAGHPGVSPHGIEAWGIRLGVGKPAHEDWSRWSDEMKHRNQKDVIINWMLIKHLEEELGEKDLYYATNAA